MTHRWGDEFARFKWKCVKCGTEKHHVWRNEVKYTTVDGLTTAHAPACSGPALRTARRLAKRVRATPTGGEGT